MTDFPPKVDFTLPPDALAAIRAQRARLMALQRDIESAMRDVDRFSKEGALYAGIAAGWAATLMVCDILKVGLSAMDRRAAVLFKAQDRQISNANKVLKTLGLPTLTSKEELMAGVDPNLQGAIKLTSEIREAQAFLKKQGAKAPKHIALLIDLGTVMADDTVLLIQAGQEQNHVRSNAENARNSMRSQLMRIRQRIEALDREFSRLFEAGLERRRTA
jgi:hypothetical protein